MESKQTTVDIHADHVKWRNSLDFYKDELKILTHRLEDVASKNTRSEVLAEVEHFQNQFIIQRENIDELEHIIIVDEDIFTAEMNHPERAQSIHRMADHEKEGRLMNSLEKNFQVIRKEFNEFLARWL